MLKQGVPCFNVRRKERIMEKMWGYARVSTKEQNLDRQITSIKKHYPEIQDEDIYQDKKSGKNFEREAYIELKKVLRKGDTLVIKDTDRLGRNKPMVKKELTWMMEKGIKLRILSIPTTLTDLDENDWVMQMISSILIEVFTSVDEHELEDIREKQREGVENAKKKGVYKGGKVKVLPKEKFIRLYTKVKAGRINGTDAADSLGLTRQTFAKRVRDYEAGKTEEWLEEKENDNVW